jgi:hypothetical protein
VRQDAAAHERVGEVALGLRADGCFAHLTPPGLSYGFVNRL